MIWQQEVEVRTSGRQATEITHLVTRIVSRSALTAGVCHLFILHTSASLMVCENADPAVLADLEAFMARLVPDGDALFRHRAEGPDDMPAHVRSVLTASSLSVPVGPSGLLLGTWQGIYLWEHRARGNLRRVVVTVQGESAGGGRAGAG